MSKISRLKISNAFGIKEMELRPKDVNIFQGKNGTGKTSILEAIKLALSNEADKPTQIFKGENEAILYVETDDGISIDRKKRDMSSDYVKVNDGFQNVGKAETFLRDLFTGTQFNPIKDFIEAKPADQKKILLSLVKIDWTMDDFQEWFGEIPKDVDYSMHILEILDYLQSDKSMWFLHRQDINRKIKEKKAVVKEYDSYLPDNYDGNEWRGKDLSEYYDKVTEAQQHNAKVERARQILESFDDKKRGIQANYHIALSNINEKKDRQKNTLTAEIEELKRQIAQKEEQIKSLDVISRKEIENENIKMDAAIKDLENVFQNSVDAANESLMDVKTYKDQADYVAKMKEHINNFDRKIEVIREISGLETDAEVFTAKIEKARELPGELLETRATMPVEGLEVKDGEVYVNGLRIQDLSDGEKDELAILVALERMGKLKILLIDGAEKMDEERQQKLIKKAIENGVQLFITKWGAENDLTVIQYEKEDIK